MEYQLARKKKTKFSVDGRPARCAPAHQDTETADTIEESEAKGFERSSGTSCVGRTEGARGNAGCARRKRKKRRSSQASAIVRALPASMTSFPLSTPALPESTHLSRLPRPAALRTRSAAARRLLQSRLSSATRRRRCALRYCRFASRQQNLTEALYLKKRGGEGDDGGRFPVLTRTRMRKEEASSKFEAWYARR